MLRERMPEVLAIQLGGPTSISDRRMNALKDVARMSIGNMDFSMMLGFVHRVEIYNGMSTRQENLVELSWKACAYQLNVDMLLYLLYLYILH